MTDRIAMESDDAYVEMLPSLGGAVTSFCLKKNGERLAVFRRWTGDRGDPRTVSCSPMVPWFNRLSGGGFSFEGTFYPVAPNDPVEPFPIHGDGWNSEWTLAQQSLSRIVLTRRSSCIPPFDYAATQVATLTGGRLTLELKVKHCGEKRLPYGLGFHPWFDRTAGVTIQAPADGVWLEQPPDFPAKPMPESVPAKWDFNTPHALPDDFIDNGFAGWNGQARIEWPDKGMTLDIEADPPTPYYHLYSPDKNSSIFCLEPVTHPFNALGMGGEPEALGLSVLCPGEETAIKVHFTARLR